MKTKLKIIIPIASAVTAIILALIFIQFKPNEKTSVSEMIRTAQNYLVENNYEQAIAEFEKAIELDPMNVEAYIGIAEAYEAIGNRDMAAQWLEKGFEATGDERLQEKLEEILSGDVEAAEVVITTAEETTTTEVTTPKPVEEFITIKGEKYSILLTELYLYDEDLTNEDIKELYKMTNLTDLNLGVNKISDISVLSDLTNLTKLCLGGNEINDISVLSGLTNLTELQLWRNEISDISALSSLTSLNVLDLDGNNIVDIEILKFLVNLQELCISNNGITDITPLSKLTNLEKLEIVTDVNGILPQIEDLTPLENLINLKELWLQNQEIADQLYVVGKLENLEFLNISHINGGGRKDGGYSVDIGELKSLTNLKTLYADMNAIDDISVLSDLTQLTTLCLDLNGLWDRDMAPIYKLTNLTSLSVYSNNISDSEIEKLQEALPNCFIGS